MDCPGYRDQLELSFRDENERILRKVRLPSISSTSKSKKTPSDQNIDLRQLALLSPTRISSSEVEFCSGSPSISHRSQTAESNQMLVHTQIPSSDEGINFVLTHYLMSPYKCSSMAQEIYSFFLQNETLEAVSSLGLAGLSNATKDPKYMVLARKKHSETMQGVIKELGDMANADLEILFQESCDIGRF